MRTTYRVALTTIALASITMLVGCAPEERADAQQNIEHAGEQIRDGAETAGETVREGLDEAGERIREGADRTREVASEFANVNAVRLGLHNAGVTEADGADIEVDGNDARVILSGTVPDKSLKEKAQVAAQEALDTINSSAEIDNRIRVQ
ncbi:MAG: BON domain-containing protein [Fimbriimonadaceae bacterium]